MRLFFRLPAVDVGLFWGMHPFQGECGVGGPKAGAAAQLGPELELAAQRSPAGVQGASHCDGSDEADVTARQDLSVSVLSFLEKVR